EHDATMVRFRPVVASALAWSMGAVVAVAVGLLSLRHIDGELSGELIHPLVPQGQTSQVHGAPPPSSAQSVPQGQAPPDLLGDSGSATIPFATASPVATSAAGDRNGGGGGGGSPGGAPAPAPAPAPTTNPPAAPPPTVGADETFSSPGGTVVAHCDNGGNA